MMLPFVLRTVSGCWPGPQALLWGQGLLRGGQPLCVGAGLGVGLLSIFPMRWKRLGSCLHPAAAMLVFALGLAMGRAWTYIYVKYNHISMLSVYSHMLGSHPCAVGTEIV